MDVTPFVNPNSSKCIRCGKCKAVCKEQLIKTVSIFNEIEKEKSYENK